MSAMQIETYETEEIQGELGNMAADAEAADLIEKLGLDGQRQLLNPETCTRNPYRVMTAEEHLVYKSLLEKRVPLDKFSDEAIPLRVLQVAAHARGCGLFDKLEVWSAEPAVLKDDPILVGFVKIDGGERLHILARWGKSLLPLMELEGMAIIQARKKMISKVQDIKRQVERMAEQAETCTDLKWLNRTVSFWDYAD